MPRYLLIYYKLFKNVICVPEIFNTTIKYIFDYHITFVNFTKHTNIEGYFMIEKPVLDDGQKYFTSQQEFFKLKWHLKVILLFLL